MFYSHRLVFASCVCFLILTELFLKKLCVLWLVVFELSVWLCDYCVKFESLLCNTFSISFCRGVVHSMEQNRKDRLQAEECFPCMDKNR